MDRKYVMTAIGYGILGLILGIYMAATRNHSQLPTHAHIMLLGFVVSFIYGASFKLWLSEASGKLVSVQFYLHQIGTPILLLSLFLMYGNVVAAKSLAPFLALSSILILAGMICFKVLFIKNK
ncbi:MAG: TonB-dependent receptor [Agarilytica sp.]